MSRYSATQAARLGTSQLAQDIADEQANRNELFAGRNGNGRPMSAPMQEEEMTVDDLVNKAERTHKETTATAERARKVLNDTKMQQEAIITELDAQDQKLNKMDNRLTQVNQDLTYAEKVLRYMRRCCCCWMCDSCTGADPESQVKKNWEKNVDKGRTQKPNQSYMTKGNGQVAAGQGQGSSKTAAASSTGDYRDPDIRLGDEHKAAEMRMHQETRKQNEILDEIHQGLNQVLHNAKVIGVKVEESTQNFEQFGQRVQDTKGRLHNVNTKSQLRDFR